MPDQTTITIAPPVLLVVDDDPAVLGSLKFSLEIEGFVVRTYPDARALLADADLPAFGCLVIDQILPDMSGLDLLAALRARGVTLPALLITTNPKPDLQQRAALAGVAVVEKPLLNNALVEGIRSATAGHG